MKRFCWFALSLILGLGLGLGVYQARASQTEPLARQALPRGIFPQEFQRTEAPITSPEDPSHPLNNVESIKSPDHPALRFSEGYGVTVFALGKRPFSGGLVGHFLYRYANEDQARQAAEALVREWKLEPGLQPSPNGWIFEGFDSEGFPLYTWIRIRGNVISLLIVNGPSTKEIFERAVQALSVLR
ncbi:MAG TPA: hypothetical protein VNK89_13170 [Thermoflexus sp.]|nr:hypothetical protein [Thermoflexus sp.]